MYKLFIIFYFYIIFIKINPLFHILNINNIIQLYTCILTEQKVIIYSNDISLLTPVSDSILSLLFPFNYCHFYCPGNIYFYSLFLKFLKVLPQNLLEFINAPIPFFIGIHSKCIQEINKKNMIPNDVNFFYL